MRAVMYDGAIHVRDIPRPAFGARESLLKVLLAGICSTDLEITRGYKGFQGVLGHEVVGTVVESANARWLGKRVCPQINIGCGTCTWCKRGVREHCEQRTVLGILGRQGAFAEYVAVPTVNLHGIPESVPDEQAVFVEPLAAAFEIVEQVGVAPGDDVAVLGDGKLGLLCAQVLALTGASVTVIGKHAEKLALLEGRGISVELVSDCPDHQFDDVIEATGSSSGIEIALSLTRPRGTLVLKSTTAVPAPVDLSPVVVKEFTVVGSRCGPFDRAIAALRRSEVDVEGLISGRFGLHRAQEAFRAASTRGGPEGRTGHTGRKTPGLDPVCWPQPIFDLMRRN